jgi:gamma-glutamyltranspeptidase / glutathione hydrolase
MHFDFSALGKPTLNRKPLFASNGVVATSQHLASQAGLAILKQGGNAVDAALAAAITLTVVEPTCCDIGGDLFALVWDGNKLHALNGSGRAPAGLTPEEVRKRGYEAIPFQGWLSVTVPGVPAAWHDLHQRFGKLPFAALFEAAIAYAEKGFFQRSLRRGGGH